MNDLLTTQSAQRIAYLTDTNGLSGLGVRANVLSTTELVKNIAYQQLEVYCLRSAIPQQSINNAVCYGYRLSYC